MNIVPTVHTQRMASRLIRATPELGAEATLSALAHTPPDQVPALVALLARHAAAAICVPPAATLPTEVVDITRRARNGAPIQFTEAQRREAHRRYRTGDRTPPVVAGEREYQRLRARVKRMPA